MQVVGENYKLLHKTTGPKLQVCPRRSRSWRDTLTHAGKLVIIPAVNAPATAFDLDEVRVETLEP